MKLFKRDTINWTVRIVNGEPYPGSDEEGAICYLNTHFKNEEDAWKSLIDEAAAGVSLAADRVKTARFELLSANEKAATAAIAFATAQQNKELAFDGPARQRGETMRRRQFVQLSRAWYGEANLAAMDVSDEITVSMEDQGEILIQWIKQGDGPAAKLSAFHDSWGFLWGGFQDVLEKMAQSNGPTPVKMCEILKSCGIEDATPEMPAFEDLYSFICRNYKNERFQGRDTPEWGADYSKKIVQSYMEDLKKHGIGLISSHETLTGKEIRFDRRLKALPDRPAKRPGSGSSSPSA